MSPENVERSDRSHPPCCTQSLQQRAERPTSMTDRLLRRDGRIAEGHTQLGCEKMRIIPKAVTAGRAVDDRAGDFSMHDERLIARAPCRRADEPRTPIRHAAQAFQQERVI